MWSKLPGSLCQIPHVYQKQLHSPGKLSLAPNSGKNFVFIQGNLWYIPSILLGQHQLNFAANVLQVLFPGPKNYLCYLPDIPVLVFCFDFLKWYSSDFLITKVENAYCRIFLTPENLFKNLYQLKSQYLSITIFFS